MDDCAEHKIRKLLHLRHAPPEWLMWGELTIVEGAKYRRADMFAMSQWRSSHYSRVGYEIKISRADYMNEIKDPSKREPIMRHCNQFYYVVPLKLIHPDEIPENCGLIELTKGGLRIKKIAKQRECEPLSMALMVRMLGHKMPKRDMSKLQLFKFAGRELTEEDFQSLIAEKKERWDYTEKNRISCLAQEMLRENIYYKEIQKLFGSYNVEQGLDAIRKAHANNGNIQAINQIEYALQDALKVIEKMREKHT